MVRIFRSDKAGDPVTDIEDVKPSRNATYGRGPYGSGLYGSGTRYG